MAIDLDTLIFVGFLLVNLGIGLYYSRNVVTITEYAIGNKNFSTTTMITTIVSTYVGAGVLSSSLTESYRQGLYFIIPVIGEALTLIIIGFFLVPRMVGFLESLSIAEMMGKLYGKHIRIITAIAGMLAAFATVAMQFKVSASILQLFFGIDSFYALALSTIVVAIYSSFGGVKAVVFTDMFQFFTFSIIIPLLCIAIWKTSTLGTEHIFHLLSQNPLFDYKEILSTDNPRFFSLVMLFLFFAIPGLDPAIVQRISMSSGVPQAQKSFIISSCIAIVFVALLCWTGILLLSNNPHLDPDNLLSYIINTYAYTGLKGLTAAAIMAIIMSTADSFINASTVLLAHDILKPLKIEPVKPKNQLLLLHGTALSISIISFVFAYKTSSIFHLLLKSYSFYMPVVTVPLLLAIFGFRFSPNVVLAGMAAGTIAVVLLLSSSYEINETVVGMFANLLVTLIGWLISRNSSGSDNAQPQLILKPHVNKRKLKEHKFFIAIKNFSLLGFCQNNLLKSGYSYSNLGVFVFISTFSTIQLFATELKNIYPTLLDSIYISSLMISFILMTSTIWTPGLKSKKMIAIFYTITIPYILIFVPTTLLVLSNFKKLQIIIFLIDIIILSLVMRWQVALVMLILVGIISIKFCTFIMSYKIDATSLIDQWAQFKIVYAILFISAIIIAFLKPKQEEQELVEEKLNYLSHEITDQKSETSKAIDLKNKFLRNLQHETNAPLTGVYSMSQALDELYDKLTDEQRKAAIHTIHTSSERLTSYFSNMLDLSKLSGLGYELRLSKVNLSTLLDYTLTKCQKLYIPQNDREDRDFVLDIEPDITVECDEYYIGRAMENIITNAIQYCKKGQIIITLKQMKDQNQEQSNVIFSVKDSGVGIPTEDLHKIFDSFTTSTRTETPAGGRGVGLTLAKTAIELHKGNITCTSDLQNGSRFTLTIPVNESRSFA